VQTENDRWVAPPSNPLRPHRDRALSLRARVPFLSLYRRPDPSGWRFLMVIRSWIRRLFDRKPRTVRKDLARFQPRLEDLEARTRPPTVGTSPDLIAAIQTASNVGGDTTITLTPGVTFDFTSPDNNSDGANALPVIHGGINALTSITIVGNGATIERIGA